ncbi:MAG: hypothetical protein JXA20_18125 [Spirochaetes bacterium]|nr:hypothetical protein [Spirochaetota bacterium]
MSLTLRLWGPLHLLTNASALYLTTNYRADCITSIHQIQVYHTVGFNGTVSLAWYVEPASVTISLGFRYQYLHYVLKDGLSNDWAYSDSKPQPLFEMMNDDHFYGITLAAVYSLEL